MKQTMINPLPPDPPCLLFISYSDPLPVRIETDLLSLTHSLCKARMNFH